MEINLSKINVLDFFVLFHPVYVAPTLVPITMF